MELRIPTLEQLRTVYDRDLRTAFPAAELKTMKIQMTQKTQPLPRSSFATIRI